MHDDHPLLVAVTGAGPGMGKTTLAVSLAQRLRATHVSGEALIFERQEFARVAAVFRSGRHASARQIERAYARFANTIERSRAVTVVDASFVDLAEDLRWALSSEPALHEHSRRMRVVLQPVRPLTLFLDGAVSTGIRRRVLERGRGWFDAYDAPQPGERWDVRAARLEAYFEYRRRRLRSALEAGGWAPRSLDATRRAEDVLDAATAICAA